MKCALCLKENDLVNSHIIPEFFYKPLYDDIHRFNVIPLSDEQRRSYEQKGLRERLLCNECDNKQLSKWENYVRGIFYGGSKSIKKSGNPLIIEGIDYKKFKLFQLSLLWRASVSSLPFFKGVNLGPHENKIREMLINELPGSKFKYPCLLYMIFMDESKVLDDFICPPEMLKKNGHRVFRFVLGGGFWMYFVPNHTYILNASRFEEYFLSESGKLVVPLKSAEEIKFFTTLAKDIVKHI